jgi:ElaB/YqjD/DUF883 family membrane-anchored ribosome-binding protein
MPYKDYNKTKEQALKNYYANREQILKAQAERWKKKYQTNVKFRAKRVLRDKSRNNGKGKKESLAEKSCSVCGLTEDLQRHHPNYESTDYIILCRKCHNELHSKLKESLSITSSCEGGQ